MNGKEQSGLVIQAATEEMDWLWLANYHFKLVVELL